MIATDCFQSHPPFGRKQCKLDQEIECCISQGSAVTLLVLWTNAKSLVSNLLRMLYYTPKIIKIGSLLTELL